MGWWRALDRCNSCKSSSSKCLLTFLWSKSLPPPLVYPPLINKLSASVNVVTTNHIHRHENVAWKSDITINAVWDLGMADALFTLFLSCTFIPLQFILLSSSQATVNHPQAVPPCTWLFWIRSSSFSLVVCWQYNAYAIDILIAFADLLCYKIYCNSFASVKKIIKILIYYNFYLENQSMYPIASRPVVCD